MQILFNPKLSVFAHPLAWSPKLFLAVAPGGPGVAPLLLAEQAQKEIPLMQSRVSTKPVIVRSHPQSLTHPIASQNMSTCQRVWTNGPCVDLSTHRLNGCLINPTLCQRS